MHIVCQYGNIEIAQILLDNGADLNMPNNFGATPLHILAQHPMFDLMNLFIQKGADLNKRDRDKETPLILAVRARIVENVERLINAENINMSNINHDTAVHIACQNGFSEILNILISHDANIHLKNKDGNMPIHIATIYKQRECVEILIEAGANILELNDRYKSAFAMSTGEITTLMKKEIEKFHKQNKNLDLRHADQVTIALSKNTRASSRTSFRQSSRQSQNSQTQSRISSRASSRASSRLSSTKQQTSRQQENINDQKLDKDEDQRSVVSKTSRYADSKTKRKTQQPTEIEYLEDYMQTIDTIIEDAQSRFDIQIKDVKQELADLIEDLEKYDIVPSNDQSQK